MFRPLTRREMLLRSANGFGAAALAALLQSETQAADPFAPKKPHFEAKAKSVIFLFMDGGPSQVDTFDPKPLLEKYHGKPFPTKVEPTQFNNVGNTLASPWKFKQVRRVRAAGQRPVPARRQVRRRPRGHPVDGRELLRAHQRELLPAHRQRASRAGRAWARGSPTASAASAATCPAFVVLGSGMIPPGGLDCFGSGFLPAAYQGSLFQHGAHPVADITPPGGETAKTQRREARPAPQARRRRRRSGSATATRSKRPSPTTNSRSGCRRPCRN